MADELREIARRFRLFLDSKPGEQNWTPEEFEGWIKTIERAADDIQALSNG